MNFYSHRINSIKELTKVSPSVGVEIDIREKNSKLVLSHEPFSNDFTESSKLMFSSSNFSTIDSSSFSDDSKSIFLSSLAIIYCMSLVTVLKYLLYSFLNA